MIKDHLVRLAKNSDDCGRCTKAIVDCLTCLDANSGDYGEVSNVEDDIVVGVKLIESV